MSLERKDIGTFCFAMMAFTVVLLGFLLTLIGRNGFITGFYDQKQVDLWCLFGSTAIFLCFGFFNCCWGIYAATRLTTGWTPNGSISAIRGGVVFATLTGMTMIWLALRVGSIASGS